MRGSRAGALIVLVLLVMSARAAASNGLQAANPTWTRDGTEIAFAYVGDGRQWLEVMRASDGGGKHPLYVTRDGCCEPVIGAAGNRIAFIENFTLTSVAATGGKATKLFASTPWFILSPNGETAAFDDGCGCGHAPDSVALIDVRGGKPTIVPRPKNATDSIDGFTPDGTQLVFTRAPWNHNGNPKGTPQILTVSVRGGAPRPLHRSGLPANAVWPQWSPDGKWIAFIAPGSTPRLELVSTMGGAPTVLVSSLDGVSSFSWSPTSMQIAYTQRLAVGRLATVDLHGNQTVLSGSASWVSDDSWDRPQWSPDGSKLVFMARDGIWVVGADGSGLTLLARSS